MSAVEPGAKEGSDRIFVPLSLVINPDLPDGLLKKSKKDPNPSSTSDGTPLPPGDGLNTGMAIPLGEEVINMATLPKDAFLDVIRKGGLPTERVKRET